MVRYIPIAGIGVLDTKSHRFCSIGEARRMRARDEALRRLFVVTGKPVPDAWRYAPLWQIEAECRRVAAGGKLLAKPPTESRDVIVESRCDISRER